MTKIIELKPFFIPANSDLDFWYTGLKNYRLFSTQLEQSSYEVYRLWLKIELKLQSRNHFCIPGPSDLDLWLTDLIKNRVRALVQ